MREFLKPLVVVSKCIEFEHCRYNGLVISSDVVKQLTPFVKFSPVCPELEIGLGVPRDPVRVIQVAGELRLFQPARDRDLTEKMRGFVHSFLKSIQEVDGFILKGRSPSCGLKDVKAYPGKEGTAPSAKGGGFFGDAVLERFPYLAVEDEGRLRNFRIREHFLTKLFALTKFRQVRSSGKMGDLVRFHSEQKFLLMSYSQKQLAVLGRTVANQERRPALQVMKIYEDGLLRAFSHMPRYSSNINVLMHALGYFSKALSHEEKGFFLDSLELYRATRVPLSVPLNIVRSWIVRFDEQYLKRQTFFTPFPEQLMEITDSGRDRDF